MGRGMVTGCTKKKSTGDRIERFNRDGRMGVSEEFQCEGERNDDNISK
jgi:hypothetical protein